MFSAKNSMTFGQASMDLGLGDQLKAQTEDTIEEQKKKKLMGTGGGLGGQSMFGPATMSLFSMAGTSRGGI